jgi:hypothetical protein
MQKNNTKKTVLKLFILFLVFCACIPAVVTAQEYTDVEVTLEVEQGEFAEITADGCWKSIAGDWDWSGSGDTTLTLLQPGHRETDGSAGGDPADGTDTDWGTVTGTVKYNDPGLDPNGAAFAPSDGNAFGYGDCKFTVTMLGYTDYAIELYGTTFLHTNTVNEIRDMVDYNNSSTFNYTLNAELPPDYDYVPNQGEHGFYIVAQDIDPTLINVELDTGAAAEITYDIQKKYTATDCGTSRPCYHFIPFDDVFAQHPQVLFTEAAGEFENKTLIIRTGLGIDYTFSSGDYSLTVTVNLHPLP